MFQLQVFSGKHENERILFLSHAHVLVLIQKILLPLSSFIFLIFLFFLFLKYVQFLPASIFFVFMILWQLFEIFSYIYCYFSTFFVITDRRVYVQKKKRLFIDLFTESVELSAIKETNAKRFSVLQFLFHFGDIHVGASGAPSFAFANLPHPEDVSLYLDKIVSLLARKQVPSEKLPVFIYSKKEYLESKRAEYEQSEVQKKVKNLLGK